MMFSHHELACNCTPQEAWDRVDRLTGEALAGDRLAIRILAWHVEHAVALSDDK